jgi:hypothetical protein
MGHDNKGTSIGLEDSPELADRSFVVSGGVHDPAFLGTYQGRLLVAP